MGNIVFVMQFSNFLALSRSCACSVVASIPVNTFTTPLLHLIGNNLFLVISDRMVMMFSSQCLIVDVVSSNFCFGVGVSIAGNSCDSNCFCAFIRYPKK